MKKDELMNENVKDLNECRRFKLIRQLDIDKEIFEYLKMILCNLLIEIGNSKETIMDLMKKGVLEGKCWQTTEAAIVFFNDEDTIERGNLIFGPHENARWFKLLNIEYTVKEYEHSWICFKFNDIMWVFDPCLQIVAQKEVYYHIFEITEVAGIVSAKEVREELICKIQHNEKQKEIRIFGDDNPNAPMYRSNGTGYTASTSDNGKINNLIISYYYEF